MPAKTFFIKQLQKLPASRRLEVYDKIAKICCPFHNGGKERTPSMIINIEKNGKYQAGKLFCFGCSERVGDWDDLAKHFKLAKLSNNTELDPEISDKDRAELFGASGGEDDFIVGSKIDPMIEFLPLWNKKDKWRSINGKIIHKLQGRLIPTDFGNTQLYLPVYVRNVFYGGVKARLKKVEGRPSYFNDEGEWIKQVIYPFDYVSKLLDKQKRRVLFFGEGSRDALNPLQYDVPAAVNLGGITVWSKAKALLLQDLNLDLLVIATDPDEVGNKTAKAIYSDMKGYCPMKRMIFNNENGEKSDPGNTSKERWLRLKHKLGII